MKILRSALIPCLMALTALLSFSSCHNELLESAEDEIRNQFTINWIKTFGLIDSEQDFNMATHITADIDPSGFGDSFEVNVYNSDPRKGGVLIARVSEPVTLGLDVSEDATSVYVRAYTPDHAAYMSAEYPIVNGTVDIRAKSRGEMPLTRADSNLTEVDGYQWILACEDLGSTDDYDFNDIVIGVNYVAETATSGTLTVTPLAAGGTLKAYVYYYDEGTSTETLLFEIHQPLNGEGEGVPSGRHSMYNTTEWHNPGPSAAKSLTVTSGFSIATKMGNFRIKVINNTTEQGLIIEAPTKGTPPQIICVKGDWEWPKERVQIQNAYPLFKNWSQDRQTSEWNEMKVVSNVIKRIVGSVTVGDVELGHEYVDLGLPSGTLWATCNVGANYPEDYGNYYAWGETAPKDSYTSSNSTMYGKSLATMNNDAIIDVNNTLTADYDAASVNWGSSWRMPTSTEMQELIDHCSWQQTSQNGVEGYRVTGSNGNYIFLPFTGYMDGTSSVTNPSNGKFWSSTASDGNMDANTLIITSSNHSMNDYYRYYGVTVRPVVGTPPSEIAYEYVDLGLASGTLWATRNVGADQPMDIGYYYAWGETEPKDSYRTTNSLWYNYTTDELKAAGVVNSKNILNPAYDAATVNIGSNWRMPTKEEIEELAACTWTLEGKYDYGSTIITVFRVTGPNGNYILLPTGGCHLEITATNFNAGFYWSSSNYEEPREAYLLTFAWSSYQSNPTDYHGSLYSFYRWRGYPVRAVRGGIIENDGDDEDDGGAGDEDVDKWVDMGLPSGLLWASCNLGASVPYDWGNFYAWGETQSKVNYYSDNYAFKDYTSESALKSAGIIDSNKNLTSTYDVATQKLGSGCRIPTYNDYRELRENCTVKSTEMEEHTGYLLTSKINGNTIFMPCAGWISGSEKSGEDIAGMYWLSTFLEYNTSSSELFAEHISFMSINTMFEWNMDPCYRGCTIRPVKTP